MNNHLPSLSPLWLQCRRGTHRLLHRDWCHAWTYQAREDRGYLRARHANACPAQLHGADRGPVCLHTWRAPGGRQLRHHRSARQKPIRLHPETDPDRGWRECHRHGTWVQGILTLYQRISTEQNGLGQGLIKRNNAKDGYITFSNHTWWSYLKVFRIYLHPTGIPYPTSHQGVIVIFSPILNTTPKLFSSRY